jgi:hypothetical protein
VSDHETKERRAGQAKRAPEAPPMADQPDRLDPEELDARDAAKSPIRRPAGPPMDEEPPENAEPPDVPPATLEEE